MTTGTEPTPGDTIALRCPCGEEFPSPSRSAGRGARCPACRAQVRVPDERPRSRPRADSEARREPGAACTGCGVRLRPGYDRCGRCAPRNLATATQALACVVFGAVVAGAVLPFALGAGPKVILWLVFGFGAAATLVGVIDLMAVAVAVAIGRAAPPLATRWFLSELPRTFIGQLLVGPSAGRSPSRGR